MFLSSLLSQPNSRAEIASAQVAGSAISAGGAADGALLFAPYGLASLPPGQIGTLLLPLEDSYACAGFLSDTSGLLPGEIRLRAHSGAEILLCQDGSICLNGLTITAQGQILPKED